MNDMYPEDWHRLNLPDVCYFQEGPGLRNWQYTASGFPFINIRCIRDGFLDLSNAQYISVEEAEENYQRFFLDAGDYVLSSSGTLGRMAKVKATDLPLMLNTSVIRFRTTNESLLSQSFMPYYLQSAEFVDQITEESQGSAQVNFGPTHLKLVKCCLPPFAEQQKIATILSSVDDVIEKTRAQIDKLKDLKTGMMQELLTKGIGHTEFKDSPVGQVPASWDVIILGDVCEFTQGVQITSADMVRDNRPGYIRYMYIRDFTSDSRLWFVKDEHPNKIITSGDLAMANTGHTSGTVYKGKYGVLSNNAFKISFDHDVVETDFLLFFLKSDFFLKKIQQLFNTAGQPHVGHGNIARMPTPLPPLAEQKRISSIMNKIETAMQEKEKAYRKYLALKKALMQDLLTGKVRVKLTDKESAVV